MVDCVVDFNTFEDMFSTWLYIENQEILSFVIAMHGEQYLLVSQVEFLKINMYFIKDLEEI